MLPRDVLFLRIKPSPSSIDLFSPILLLDLIPCPMISTHYSEVVSASDRIDLHASSNLFGFTYFTKSLHVSFPITKMWLSFIWICSIIVLTNWFWVQSTSIFNRTFLLDLTCTSSQKLQKYSRNSRHILLQKQPGFIPHSKKFSALLQKWYYILMKKQPEEEKICYSVFVFIMWLGTFTYYVDNITYLIKTV